MAPNQVLRTAHWVVTIGYIQLVLVLVLLVLVELKG